jgi:hypothetical protein
MVDTKTIGYSALSAIIATLIVLGGVNLLDDKVYYCEARATVMKCDSLTQYYGLVNGKCLNKEVGNKLCVSGWIEVTDDTEFQTPDDFNEFVPMESAKGDFLCTYDGCKKI